MDWKQCARYFNSLLRRKFRDEEHLRFSDMRMSAQSSWTDKQTDHSPSLLWSCSQIQQTAVKDNRALNKWWKQRNKHTTAAEIKSVFLCSLTSLALIFKPLRQIRLIQIHHLQSLLEPLPSAPVLRWHVTSGSEGLVLTVWRQTHVSSSDVQLARPGCQRHQCHCRSVLGLSLPLLPLSVQLHPQRRRSHFFIWPCDDTDLTHGCPAHFNTFYFFCLSLTNTLPGLMPPDHFPHFTQSVWGFWQHKSKFPVSTTC